MVDSGFAESARVLARESQVSLSSTDASDGKHLKGVLREWQDAREISTGQRPILTTHTSAKNKSAAQLAAAPGKAGATAGAERRRERLMAEREAARVSMQSLDISPEAQESFNAVPPGHPLLRQYSKTELDGKPEGGTALAKALEYFEKRKIKNEKVLLAGDGEEVYRGDDDGGEGCEGDDSSSLENTQRVLKPPPSFGGDSELKELAKTLTRDIYTKNPNVRWADVAGLNEAKILLNEAVVMPVRFPQFFTGLLTPWRGVLLYGPPGTGKTLLAKAVATECRTTFFNISASSVVSKWRGDSEKLIRTLFELARYHAPSTVFLDEIDAVMGSRDGGGGSSSVGGSSSTGNDHEASRRMKTELLIQLDGVARGEDDGLVFLLAATNLPWALDPALLRRLEKRIFVDLPTLEARKAMVTKLLQPHTMEENNRDALLNLLAEKTHGYSGSDVATLCKECAMRPLRRLMSKLDGIGALDGAEAGSVGNMNNSDASIGPITSDDVDGSLRQSGPTHTEAHAKRYTQWTAAFGMKS